MLYKLLKRMESTVFLTSNCVHKSFALKGSILEIGFFGERLYRIGIRVTDPEYVSKGSEYTVDLDVRINTRNIEG